MSQLRFRICANVTAFMKETWVSNTPVLAVFYRRSTTKPSVQIQLPSKKEETVIPVSNSETWRHDAVCSYSKDLTETKRIALKVLFILSLFIYFFHQRQNGVGEPTGPLRTFMSYRKLLPVVLLFIQTGICWECYLRFSL